MRSNPFRIVAVLLVAAFVAAPPARARDLIPPNDNFADATVVDELPYVAVRDVALSTTESDEPLCRIGGSIWYRLALPAGTQVGVSVGYAQAKIAVYEGTSLATLEMRACGTRTQIIDVSPGGSIYVQVIFEPETLRVPSDHVVVSFTELGGISGVVRDEFGAPIAGTCVRADNYDDYEIGPIGTTTQSDGSYLLDHLIPGNYTVMFGCDGGPYRIAWWRNQDLVPVGAGRVSAAIDATLVRLSQLQGTVRNAAGLAVSACVDVYDATTEALVDWDYTDSAGAYSVPVPAGSYKLHFGCAFDLEPEWYDDKRGFTQADVVAVGERQDLTGLDAVLDVWMSPPGDTPQTAIPIESFPFSMVAPFGSAKFDSADGSMCNDNVLPGLWFRYQAQTADPIVVELDDQFPAYAVFEQQPERMVLRACTNAGDGRRSIAFAPQAGRTYLIQVAGVTESDERVTAALSTGIEPQLWDSLVPCLTTCDFQPDVVCADDPGAAPGSFEDVMVTVPALIGGEPPTHLVAIADPALDRDLVVCRPEGTSRHMATAAGGTGLQEGVAVAVSPGEAYRVRVFNWADAVAAPGSISFVVES